MELIVVQVSKLESFIKLIDILIWPCTFLIIILLFRKNLQNAFNRIGSIKADATGIAITFDKQLEATAKLFQQIQPKAISKSSASIKTAAKSDGSPFEQVLSVRDDIVHFLTVKSKALGLDVDPQLPSHMCSQLLLHNAIKVEQAQMIQALLNLIATANDSTTQAQANLVQQLLNRTEVI